MEITHDVTIDLLRPRQNVIRVVQEDSTRTIRLKLLSNNQNYNVANDLDEGETLLKFVEFRKADGHGGMYDTTSTGETAVELEDSSVPNVWLVNLDGQCFTAPGWTQINVRFETEDGKRIHTFRIMVDVEPTASSDTESTDWGDLNSIADLRNAVAAMWDKMFPPEAKVALLKFLRNIDYFKDEHASEYYDELEAALFQTAQIVSISAVFDQGSAVIYDTDDLETLRQYLTVTATYEDLSEREVAGYTLSGTLTEGTSTITVSYGAKTTTFTVSVTENPVPSAYQRVEWIANESNAYITTSIHFPTAFKVYLKTKLNDYITGAAYGTVLGVRIAVDSSTFGANWIYVKDTNAISSYMGASSKMENLLSIQNVLEWGSICNGSTNKLYLIENGETTYSTEESVSRDYRTATIGVFLAPYTGMPANMNTYFVGRLYAFTIYDSSNNVYADFVPVYRKADGVIGLYETESQTFFTNSGSGTFTKGDDVR